MGRLNYSFRDRLVLEGVGGIEYNAGCWVFRAVGRRIQAALQTTSQEILFQLEFNGLGQIGSDDTLTLLKRNVPGYAQTNPADRSLVPPSLQRRLPFEQVF
jgi:LPS-assembly protein